MSETVALHFQVEEIERFSTSLTKTIDWIESLHLVTYDNPIINTDINTDTLRRFNDKIKKTICIQTLPTRQFTP